MQSLLGKDIFVFRVFDVKMHHTCHNMIIEYGAVTERCKGVIGLSRLVDLFNDNPEHLPRHSNNMTAIQQTQNLIFQQKKKNLYEKYCLIRQML